MSKRVVITGLGVVSSIGIGWREFWDNLLKGTSGISPISSFDTSNQFTHNGGEVKNFRPEEFIAGDRLPTLSRASQFGLAAAKLAIQDAALSTQDLSRMHAGVCIGTTMGSIQTVEKIDELLVAGKQHELNETLLLQVLTHSTSSAIAREFLFH